MNVTGLVVVVKTVRVCVSVNELVKDVVVLIRTGMVVLAAARSVAKTVRRV